MAAPSFYYSLALLLVLVLVAEVVVVTCYSANQSVETVVVVLNMAAADANRMDTFHMRSMAPIAIAVAPHPLASSEALHLEVWLFDFYLLTCLIEKK